MSALQLTPQIQDVGGVAMVSSRDVAKTFGKEHTSVLKAIRNLDCSVDFIGVNFDSREIEVLRGSGTETLEVMMTRDGLVFLVMGFTGAKAAAFKEAYINAFNEYEKAHKGLARPLAVPQDPVSLLRFAAEEIEKERGLRLIAEQERSDATDWVTRKDAWAKVPGYINCMIPSNWDELRYLKAISNRLNLAPKQLEIPGRNGKVYRPYAFHKNVWTEYVNLYSAGATA